MCYQLQQLLQQQLPPPQVVQAPGATVTVSPPLAVLPMWPEKLSIAIPPFLQTRRRCEHAGPDADFAPARTLTMDINKRQGPSAPVTVTT
jgi:hypothetical protein